MDVFAVVRTMHIITFSDERAGSEHAKRIAIRSMFALFNVILCPWLRDEYTCTCTDTHTHTHIILAITNTHAYPNECRKKGKAEKHTERAKDIKENRAVKCCMIQRER